MHAKRTLFLSAGVVLSWTLLALPSTLEAQNVTLTLNGAEVVPGEELSLTLLGDLDQPIVGYQVGIQFPAHAMTLQGASLKSTDLENRIPEIFDVSIGFGYGTIKVFFPAPIPAGEAVRLTRLEFKMGRSLSPGSEFQVELRSGLGFPPLPSFR